MAPARNPNPDAYQLFRREQNREYMRRWRAKQPKSKKTGKPKILDKKAHASKAAKVRWKSNQIKSGTIREARDKQKEYQQRYRARKKAKEAQLFGPPSTES